MPFQWSPNGTQLVVNLTFLGGESRAGVLPYRYDAPLATVWPAGLGTAQAVLANPGARALEASNVFPAVEPAGYLTWRPSFQSNLYRIPLPQ